ncbi:MAG: divergent polysaccharide deacetylase family protein [SAR324 cluster bacterium]
MAYRRTAVLAILFAALVAATGGALLGWGVMRLKGGAAALTHAPVALSVVQPMGDRDGTRAAALAPALAARRRTPGQGANRSERLREEPARPNGRFGEAVLSARRGERSAPADPAEPHAPRLAIVIDDIGESLAAPRELMRLPVPITFSILPDLPHTRDAAEVIAQGRREFIIHLPMEPVDFPVHDPGPRPLLLSLNREQTRRRMEGYFRELPGAIGASNHMGSAYTADAERMTLVERSLADRHLFFLNSKTSPSPVPAEIAHAGRYAYLERDVFLDNDRDERLITRQLDLAVAHARRRGRAVAIGHPYPETVRALRAALTGPALRGVQLVPLSELLPRQ